MKRILTLEVVVILAVTVALLMFSMRHGVAFAKPATHHVSIEGMQFQPDAVSAARGDTIVWTNKDLFPHTVTATDGTFDSHEIKPGESWSYRVSKAGELTYVCSLHPTMKAALRVK
jgi:plastocyanin